MVTDNFVYDSEGNLIEDRSKNLKISYDWRGMPVEFRMESTRVCSIGNMDAGGVNMPQGLGRYDKVQYDAKTNLILNHLIDMSAQNYGWGKMLMN